MSDEKSFQYVKIMLPLFRAVVNFCSINRLFTQGFREHVFELTDKGRCCIKINVTLYVFLLLLLKDRLAYTLLERGRIFLLLKILEPDPRLHNILDIQFQASSFYVLTK